MNYTEKIYLDKISPYLTNFADRSNDVYNCRCPYCNDSKTNLRKTRGYFHIGDKGNLIYSCRHCSIAVPLGAFIKDHFPNVYLQFKLDMYSKKDVKLSIKKPPSTSQIKLAQFKSKTIIKSTSYQSIQSLDDNHEAKKYLLDRLIPDLSCFGYTDSFKDYVAEMTNNDTRYEKLPKDKRIIIPLALPNGTIVGFQGRSLITDSSLRYITIKIPEHEDEYVKLFGLGKFDKDKAGFIVEGSFDSLFLPNAIAMCGTSLDSNAIKRGLIIPQNTIVIIDNEPRNKQIVDKVEKYIDSNFRVYIPPKNLTTSDKDINKMVLSGISKCQLIEIFVKNSYVGINARIRLNYWKKI